MTYLVYAAWILSMVLAVGELDDLVARRILRRFKLNLPEVHWATSTFLSAMLPGLGQFLNGHLLKALFFVAWPFLTVYGTPIPRPWQLWGLKTPLMFLPWWLIAIGDALVAGLISHRRQMAERRAALQDGDLAPNTVDMYAYLSKRQKQQNSRR
jgi:hypothetical protein